MSDLLEIALPISSNEIAHEAVQAAQALLDEVVSGGAVVELSGFGPYGERDHVQVWLRGYLRHTPANAQRLDDLRQRLLDLPYADLYGEIQIRPLAQQDWAEAWKQHYHALRVGERLIIAPAWEQPEAAADDVIIWIEPGMAFGTGLHPSTRLAMRLLEKYIQPGQPMLDVGTGSGVLAIAAIKLGASQAWGTDIDADAITAAEANARRNRVAASTHFSVGSVPRDGRRYPVVCANILADILAELLLHQHLADTLTPDGVLILSGIIEQRRHVVDLALAACGLTICDTLYEDDWLALAVRKTTEA